MLHGMTVCPNALMLEPNILTVVYICFIKNNTKAVKSQFELARRRKFSGEQQRQQSVNVSELSV